MAENRIYIEGMWPNATYTGSTNPLPVISAADPSVLGVWTTAQSVMPGVAAANTFVTLFNPVGSGRDAFLAAAFVSGVAVAATSAVEPMHMYRLAVAPSGGSVVSNTTFFKLDSGDPDPVAEVRIGNPTVTLGPIGTSTPPPVTTGAGGGQFIHDIIPPPPSFLLLRPGEGLAFRTVSGDVSQRWNVTITWAEKTSA